MIDSKSLLTALQQQVRRLQDDLRARAASDETVQATVEAEYEAARDAGRTALSQSAWQEELFVQGAVAWVLACVFVRFMEDNDLVDDVWLSGPGRRRDIARGRRQRYFEEHPHDTDREVLHAAFRAAAAFPAVAGLFDEAHNPLWRLPISGDAARGLVELWDTLDDSTDELRPVYDFTDSARDTRFVGDLYQDLSEEAKKRYALLQTPEFVESFILDRTLNPALAEFGLPAVRLIDPTCGSGHFLIGAFERLFAAWQDAEPSTPAPELAQRALTAVNGVDVNPFAVAIARFRLIVAALGACEIKRLRDAPGWTLRLACGDSLIHGPREGQLSGLGAAMAVRGMEHHFLTEDAGLLEAILTPGYHAVVGNPPYIVARDKALNDLYRERYPTCKGKYSLAVPFMERFFGLARLPDGGGFVGKITANAFMKREFGSRLIEEFLPTVDLACVIDSSVAHLPGHDGLPTAIIFGRSRAPVTHTVRFVLGMKGERGVPEDPANGPVWTTLLRQLIDPSLANEYFTVEDIARPTLAVHPWALGAGGASALRELLETQPNTLTDELTGRIGFGAISAADDVFMRPEAAARRTSIAPDLLREAVEGEYVRDWISGSQATALFPYRDSLVGEDDVRKESSLWAARTSLWARPTFTRETYKEANRTWWEWHQVNLDRCTAAGLLTFPFMATHAHFAVGRPDQVFNRTAPVVSLRSTAETSCFGILSILNSAVACFWFHQVCQPKPGFEEAWQARYEHDGGKVARLPLPPKSLRPWGLAAAIHQAAVERRGLLHNVGDLLAEGPDAFENAQRRDVELSCTLVSLQEECDWQAMSAYGLIPKDRELVGEAAPPLNLGERAFEIVLARRRAGGEIETTWFERHGSTPITEIPSWWPEPYRAVVQQRIDLIESDRDVALIERPECKRRWSQPPWEKREAIALRSWLLEHLEGLALWGRQELVTCAQLADAVDDDPRVRLAAQRLAGTVDVDLPALVERLVLAEAVPYLAAHRYKDSGLRTRTEWEQVWALQRQEDAIDALGLPSDDAEQRKREEVGEIPVPPKYKPADFRKTDYWRLRGKLDVPKERFVLVPEGVRTGNPSPVVGWAGWDHATLAFALAGRATMLTNEDGAGAERLVPLLAGILELLPWVAQWHPEPDADTGEVPARELEDFLVDELGALGKTRDDLVAWRLPAPTRGRRRS